MREAVEQFRQAMKAFGLEPPEIIEPGKLHRFSTNGKATDDAGWCKLFPDLLGGVFGDHRSGLSETWQAKRDQPFTEAERQAEQDRQYAEAAAKAATILKTATGDPSTHPYARKKKVGLGKRVRRSAWAQRGWTDALLIPIYAADGQVWSIQAINVDGSKDYLKNGRKRGGFYPFGKIRGATRVLIAEGLATAAAAVAASGSAALAAMDADGLKHVAPIVRKRVPDAEIIFLADNDIKPDGTNPGIKAANEAARRVDGRVAIPSLDGRACDFWDVWDERGAEAVRCAIGNAKAPTSSVRAIELADFLALELPPRDYILAPWLPTQGLAMVHAPRGLGKTHVALGVAYAVASGNKFLRWTAPQARGVLFIDGEMPASVLQERFAHIVAAADKEYSAPLRIITPDLRPEVMPDLSCRDGQATIDADLNGVDLIIVDNLSTLCRTGKENEAESWLPMQGWALQQRARGRSVLFIHHSGKGGAQRGTSRREDVLDTVINLRSPSTYEPKDGAAFEIHFEKSRGFYGEDAAPFEAKLITDEHNLQSWAMSSLEDSTYERVVRLLNEGLSQTEVAKELGLKKSTVSYHAKRAKAEGRLKQND